MLNRMLMTTVAVLALTVPAVAQDKAEEATPQTGQQAEQAQQKLEEGAAQTGQTEQGQPAQPQAAQGETEQPAEEQAPPTAEGAPEGEQPPATAEGQPEGEQPPAMAQEPAEEQPPAAAEGQPEGEQQMAEEPTPPAEMKFIEVQEEAQFLANDEVIGKNVVNPNDEELGTIADLVMDEQQKLVGVVLSVGGFLGIGDKWVAVPVDQIDFPADEQPARLQIQVTREQLENAPDFVTKETAQAQQEADQAQQQMQQGTPPAPTTAQ